MLKLAYLAMAAYAASTGDDTHDGMFAALREEYPDVWRALNTTSAGSDSLIEVADMVRQRVATL